MMHENLLKHYFDQEGPKGDLSPKQWETVLNNAKTHIQADRRVWSLGQRLVPTTYLRWVATVGLSRAWTTVGVLLIAATFAVLGFGLAVLVLSNGHDQVPAAATTPTPITSIASPVSTATGTGQSAQDRSSDTEASVKLESLLSGDTLARYRALPPAFQAALDTYAWFGVPPDLIPLAVRDKMDQWGDAAIPLAEIIGEERAERFRDTRRHSSSVFSKRIQVRRADLLLSGYVYLLALEPSAERRLEVMHQLASVPMDPTDSLTRLSHSPDDSDTFTDPASDSLIWLAPPPEDAVLTKTALARLELLGPRLGQALVDAQKTANEGWMHTRQMANWLTYLEMFLLKVEPGLEVPSIDAYLSGDSLEVFEALSQEWRELAVAAFEGGIIVVYVSYIAIEPLGTFDLGTFDLIGYQLNKQAEGAVEWAVEVQKHAEEERRKNAASP